MNDTLEQRFWRKVLLGAGCWEWTAYRNAKGYGVIGTTHPRTMLAHRLSWQIAHGPIPEGLSVIHNCDNPGCVNPAHLRLGTHLDNVADKVERGRAARFALGPDVPCKRGHVGDFRIDTQKGKYPSRRCRVCDREKARAKYAVSRV